MKIILTESQFKQILQEGFSRYIYHFCPLDTLLSILKTNAFILSHIDSGIRDKELSGGYNFYMSFTREHTDKVGYVQYKNHGVEGDEEGQQTDNQYFNVRISVNGEALGSNYRGEPVNYHNKENWQNKQQQWAAKDPIKLIQIRQSEDRLLSNKPVVENAGRYIERIDVLLHPDENGKILKSALEKCAKILRYDKTGPFKNKIFIYDRRELFNAPQVDGFINDKIITMLQDAQNQYGDYYDVENNKVKANAPGKYEYYLNPRVERDVTLKRGKDAVEPMTDGQKKYLANMVRYLVLADEFTNEQVPEEIDYIFTMRDKSGSSTLTNKEKAQITRLATRPVKRNVIENFVRTFRENVYKWFSSSFRGDLRSLYAYTMELYGNALKHNGVNKVQDLSKIILKRMGCL